MAVEAPDRRAFLRLLGQGAAVALLGLAGVAGIAGKAAGQEPKVLCMSREEYERLVAEGKLPQAECRYCCPHDCC
jgi:hypothetical protein